MKKTLPLIGLLLLGCSGSEQESVRSAKLLERVESLPYLSRQSVREEFAGLRGVVSHDPGESHDGLNLYASLTRDAVLLRDMDGETVHQWDLSGVFTEFESFPLDSEILERVGGPHIPGVMLAELHGQGLYVIDSMVGIARLDRHSSVEFARNNSAHHDVDVDADGRIFVLTAVPRAIDLGRESITIIDHLIEILDPAGELLGSHSLFEILSSDPGTRGLIEEQLRYARYWFEHLDEWFARKSSENLELRAAQQQLFDMYRAIASDPNASLRRSHYLYLLEHTPADILHGNALQLLPDSRWGANQCLIAVRELNLIAVLDLENGAVSWSWGPGVLDRPHQPSLLATGNILLFDNGTRRGHSRILELNPEDAQIAWSYGESESQRFFCAAMGGVQGLPNGNVLITDSGAGRVFEVTRAGKIVWDFFNPDAGFNPFEDSTQGETIESIYRMTRIEASSWDATSP